MDIGDIYTVEIPSSDGHWKADALVSYNFGHIVNLATMVAVNEVNRARNL